MSEIQMGTIQWFPGHMTKTRRMIAANLSLVDAVVEILDARIPSSSPPMLRPSSPPSRFSSPLNPPSSSLLRSPPNKAHGATLLTKSPQGMPSRAFPCSDTMDGLQTLKDPPPCSPLSPFPLLKAPQVP